MGKRGVTLVELVVVMVIIALAAVLVIPNIGSWIPIYRLRSGVREVVSTMRTAQMKAVSQNTEFRVSFDDTANTYVLERNSGGSYQREGVVQQLPKGVQISAITLPGKNAEFNPNSSSSGGSITLKNQKGVERRIVVFAATGRIRVE